MSRQTTARTLQRRPAKRRATAPHAAGPAETASQSQSASSQGVVQPLSVFFRWARLELHQRIVDAVGVSIDRSAVVILETLHCFGPMRMSELAAKIRLDRSTVSRQVTAVTESGLVEKTGDANDSRAAVLSLTARGQSVRHKVTSAWHEIAVGLIADWPAGEQAEFVRLMRKLALQLDDSED